MAAYDPDNLLDRITSAATLELQYRQVERREREILSARLGLADGRVLSVGCGWHPGRHLFPAPAFEMVGVDVDPAKVAAVRARGSVDEAHVGRAGALDLPERSFDVVLYRQVLHHVAHDQPLAPCFAEAARLLAPGGVMVAVEPGLWHPVGAALAGANRAGLGPAIHGTPDDIPLSPRRLRAEALAVGLEPELHAVTYTWRRMPPLLQRTLWAVDRLGSRPALRPFGHTLMLIARRNSAPR
ncbi:MAG: class I SAM-dependent methyltransferase [Solirubrobacteraceae bacterium]